MKRMARYLRTILTTRFLPGLSCVLGIFVKRRLSPGRVPVVPANRMRKEYQALDRRQNNHYSRGCCLIISMKKFTAQLMAC